MPDSRSLNAQPILELDNLRKHFLVKGNHPFDRKVVRAVDGISLRLDPGKTLGLVGESGSGKSTVGRCILKLLEPSDGRILFDGKDINRLPAREIRNFRRKVQMVFQDPEGCLNPRFTVRRILAEPLKRLGVASIRGKRIDDMAAALLDRVGLSASDLDKFPHQFSGGQQQRIGIARAIAPEPGLIVLDEPTSALDVSVRAQIVELLEELKRKLGLSYVLISHDLGVISIMSDLVAVMYLGRFVEVADAGELFDRPMHPYTQALLESIPDPDKDIEETQALKGEIPSPVNPPMGCCFHTRCKLKTEGCDATKPALLNVGKDHLVACHLFGR